MVGLHNALIRPNRKTPMKFPIDKDETDKYSVDYEVEWKDSAQEYKVTSGSTMTVWDETIAFKAEVTQCGPPKGADKTKYSRDWSKNGREWNNLKR